MRGYNFQLENILEWRTNIEKSTIEKFALIQREVEDQKQLLSNLIKEHDNAKRNKSYRSILEIRQHHIYIEDLEQKVEINEILLEGIKERLEEARQDLLAAQKDRKVMEKLKEKDLEEYLSKQKSIEQKELDEIGILNYKNNS